MSTTDTATGGRIVHRIITIRHTVRKLSCLHQSVRPRHCRFFVDKALNPDFSISQMVLLY